MISGNPHPEQLRELVRCDPETGRIFRISGRKDGSEAFLSPSGDGYLQGHLLGKMMLSHRVIWALAHGEWPAHDIDHINGVRSDNRLVNLRAVTRSENMRNAKTPVTNTSGVIGVNLCGRSGSWRSTIQTDGRRVHLGYFKTKAAAVSARKAAEIKGGYHENHGRSIPQQKRHRQTTPDGMT